MPHGRDDLEWNELAEAGLSILKFLAARKTQTDYTSFVQDLAVETGLRQFVFPQDRQVVGTLLADISKRGREDHPELLLSVLVHARATKMPGGGFFDLAKSVQLISEGVGEAEQMRFIVRQQEGLWAMYGRRVLR